MRTLNPARPLALLCGALLTAAALPLAAQTLPNGTYQQSCRSISLIDGTLVAECRMADQTWRATTLPNAAGCKGDISNVDGKLQCLARTSQFAEGYASFGAKCTGGKGSEFLIIRLGGRQDSLLKIVFDTDAKTEVHIFLPRGSTYAADCGGYPADSVQFNYISLD